MLPVVSNNIDFNFLCEKATDEKSSIPIEGCISNFIMQHQ